MAHRSWPDWFKRSADRRRITASLIAAGWKPERPGDIVIVPDPSCEVKKFLNQYWTNLHG